MNDKPWLDVGTLCIARLCLERCIPSFIEHLADRDDYRLRWICHLDQFGGGGLEPLWQKQLDQIVKASEMFDAFVLIANRSHVGYGGGLLRILREVRGGMIYTDDDQLFHEDISVTQAINGGHPHYNWHNTYAGSTVPSYWSPELVSYMLEHFPSKAHRVTERALGALAEKGGFVSNANLNLDHHPRDDWPSHNVGRAYTIHNGCKIRYGPHRMYVDDDGQIKHAGRGQVAIDLANE